MSAPGASTAPPSWGRANAWLRPFEELAIGDSYVSKARTVTEADIVRFAAMTGATNPAVGDPGRHTAGENPVAPELLALTYSIGLVPNRYVRALRRILGLELLEPVRRGDTIHVEAAIVRLEEWTEELGLVAGAWEIVKQDGKTAMTVELEAVWQRARR